MRIDEQGNIEVETESDSKRKIYNDYSFTCNPHQIIYTQDLVDCVGLGLLDEHKRIRKRGLMHIYYKKQIFANKNDKINLLNKLRDEREQKLEEFLSNFEKDDYGKKVYQNPRAILVYIRGVNFVRGNGFENPMANLIRKWLEDKNISLYCSEASGNKTLPSILNLDDDPKEIYSKQFALWHDKIKVGMYNKRGE